MKAKITFLFFLLFTLTHFAQSNTCDSAVNDTFDGTGALPTEWTEYNTSGDVTVVSGELKFNHSQTMPSAYRTFSAISNNVTFSFDVSASRSYSSCQVTLLSSTGKYVSTIDIGSKSSSIKYATSISAGGVPSGFTDGASKVTLQTNTIYVITANINFTSKTIDYYANGVLMAADVAFLETATNVSKLDIQSLFMYNNNGNFNFDNITLSTTDENRLSLSNAVINAQNLLNSAVIGSAGGEYSQNDYDVFSTTIEAAVVIENNCAASESEINQATADLQTAISNFEASSNPFVQSVSINAQDTKQEILMIGADMERNAAALQDAPNKEEIVDWLIKDIPFNTFRVKYDKIQEMTEGNVDMFGAYGEQVKSMKMILEANPEIKFFATMKSDYHGYSQGNRNNLPTFIYDYDNTGGNESGSKSFDGVKYGRFLADYVEYMSDNGVPITYLSTSKEWTQVMTAARAKTAIESLISNLADRNIAMPLIIDSGAWSLNQGIATINTYVSNNVDQYVHAYSAHKYGGNNTWAQYGNALNGVNKMGINDESSHGGGGQTTEDEVPMTNALSWYKDKCNSYAGGIQGELFFEVFMKNNNFNKYYARPIVFTASQNGRRMRSYYIMKKFAESVHDATYVKQTLNNFGDVNSMAFIKDNKLTLWLINSSETTYSDFSININNFGLKQGMTIKQTNWHEAAAITGDEDQVIANADNQFNVGIAPLSLTSFEIDLDDALSTEKALVNRVNIYPNPVSDKLTISDPDTLFKQYIIYNMNGQVMRSGKMTTNKVGVTLHNLSTGIYLLKLDGDTTSETHKIIKK
ncbi:T9SS type A sorting domain-containing protein [Polaribacter undariae]|uniref:T9SS type A sorting domain-containing protein n=1 Tax=Polaribacter sejongensis TaxID=985043 RepID=A0AAJ1QTT4_9FLAO|nr:T9SS type A sorting domain-containing protein [Polaribacter undariae]MDN3618128.1 T9SS type A sorting domain-containing protein [Polaribacter undariae]UWD30882.1 T9SS type A sorting domain-containing protein [Polaribacter undariae]